MWKRIQTLYTAIATLLTVSMFFLSPAVITGPEGSVLKVMYYEKMPYLVMLIMLLAAGVCALMSFRSPFLQSRVCMLAALMLTGFQIWLGVDFFRFQNEMTFSVTILFPLVSAFLNILAARSALLDGMTLQAAKKLKKNSVRNK